MQGKPSLLTIIYPEQVYSKLADIMLDKYMKACMPDCAHEFPVSCCTHTAAIVLHINVAVKKAWEGSLQEAA